MRKRLLASLMALTLAVTGINITMKSDEAKAADFYSGWKLSWSDEFNGTSLDRSVWNVEVNGYGGWNNELQYYKDSPDNLQVSDGTMKIIARHETYQGMNYTSTRINSENKVKLGNGRIEARIKLPIFKGTFPAFWLMGNNGKQWPECGEIDIMEAVNTENIAYGTAHWPKVVGSGSEDINSEGNGTYGWNLDLTQWHTYGVERDDQKIVWYVDGKTYHTVDMTKDYTNSAPLRLDAYILFNLAIGGDWPGFNIDNSAFPATMEVDYVRYYVKDDSYEEEPTVTIESDSVAEYKGVWNGSAGEWANAAGTVTSSSNASDGFTANLTKIGSDEWGAQASLENIAYTPGQTYTFKCTLNSNINKKVFIKVEGDDSAEIAAEYVELKANTPYYYEKSVTIPATYNGSVSLYYAFGGGMSGENVDSGASMYLRVSDVSFKGKRTVPESEVTTTAKQETSTSRQETTTPSEPETTTTENVQTNARLSIDGFQISTTAEGFRTIYTLQDDYDETVESGLIYAIGNPSSSDMVVDSTSANVYSYKSTEQGLIGGSANTSRYAMTMKFIKTSEFFNSKITIRPYAKLKNGKYAYGDIQECSVYRIADFLYKNNMMSNFSGHTYLYNNILKVVNPSYAEVDFDWNNTLAKF